MNEPRDCNSCRFFAGTVINNVDLSNRYFVEGECRKVAPIAGTSADGLRRRYPVVAARGDGCSDHRRRTCERCGGVPDVGCAWCLQGEIYAPQVPQ